MNAIVDMLSGPTWQHLALALLHTLWQGLAAAVLLWLLLRRIAADRPNARYCIAFSVLAGLLLCGLVTWSILDFQRPRNTGAGFLWCGRPGCRCRRDAGATTQRRRGAGVAIASRPPTTRTAVDDDVAENRRRWFALLLAGWLMGVALMAARMAWMVGRSRRLARGPRSTTVACSRWSRGFGGRWA